MSPPAKRHYVIEADEDGFPREQTLALLQDLEAVLMTVGGTVQIVAQREKYGDLGDQPLAETTALVIEWRAHSPLPLQDGRPVVVSADAPSAQVPVGGASVVTAHPDDPDADDERYPDGPDERGVPEGVLAGVVPA